ncbi:MAG: hypothetical protein ACVCEJ_02990 [Candidatus Izemoplasmataceae bacterium]
MKKIILLVLFIFVILSGCESQSNDEDNPIPDHEDNPYSDYETYKRDTLEFFEGIDFSSYEITSIDVLLYDHGESDYEYERLTNFDGDVLGNIVDMSNRFSEYAFDVGSLSVPLGGRAKLVIHLEYGEQNIQLNIVDKDAAMLFVYEDEVEQQYLTYFDAFSDQVEAIYHSLGIS